LIEKISPLPIPRITEPYRSSIYPSKFQASKTWPESLFLSRHRFIRKNDSHEILIYTDGIAQRQNKKEWKGSWWFAYRPSTYDLQGNLNNAGAVSATLELGIHENQNYSRVYKLAALRAVVEALQFRDWAADCNRTWRSLVIATPSDYIEKSATKLLPMWENNGWKVTDSGGKVEVHVSHSMSLILSRQLLYRSSPERQRG